MLLQCLLQFTLLGRMIVGNYPPLSVQSIENDNSSSTFIPKLALRFLALQLNKFERYACIAKISV